MESSAPSRMLLGDSNESLPLPFLAKAVFQPPGRPPLFSKKKKKMSFGICGHSHGVPRSRRWRRRDREGAWHIGAGWSDSILMNTAGLARVTDSPRGAHHTTDRGFKREEKLQQCVSQATPSPMAPICKRVEDEKPQNLSLKVCE